MLLVFFTLTVFMLTVFMLVLMLEVQKGVMVLLVLAFRIISVIYLFEQPPDMSRPKGFG